MSGFISKTGSKWREYRGGQVSKDETMEARKADVNEYNQYFVQIFESYGAISAHFSQISTIYKTIGYIVNRMYEKETNTNKKIGLDLQAMFNNLSELFASKVTPVGHLGDYMKEWFTTVEQLKLQMKTFHEDRFKYDHYLEKVEKIKYTVKQERNTDTKTNDKLARNVNKYENAKGQYDKIVKEIVTKLDVILDNRFHMINQSIDDFIEIDNDMMGNCKSQLKKNLKITEKFKHPTPHNVALIDKAKEGLSAFTASISNAISSTQAEAKSTLSVAEKDIDDTQQNSDQVASGLKEKIQTTKPPQPKNPMTNLDSGDVSPNKSVADFARDQSPQIKRQSSQQQINNQSQSQNRQQQDAFYELDQIMDQQSQPQYQQQNQQYNQNQRQSMKQPSQFGMQSQGQQNNQSLFAQEDMYRSHQQQQSSNDLFQQYDFNNLFENNQAQNYASQNQYQNQNQYYQQSQGQQQPQGQQQSQGQQSQGQQQSQQNQQQYNQNSQGQQQYYDSQPQNQQKAAQSMYNQQPQKNSNPFVYNIIYQQD